MRKPRARVKKFTQQELAAKLGISQGYVSKILRGKQKPSPPVAALMANLLCASIKNPVETKETSNQHE